MNEAMRIGTAIWTQRLRTKIATRHRPTLGMALAKVAHSKWPDSRVILMIAPRMR